MILGAILAGGQSRRFGSDKALALLDGTTMIDRVAQALASHVDRVVVCGREHGDWLSLADRPATGLGPLGGLAAALDYAREHDFERVVAIPCDTPSITADLLSALVSDGGPACLAACPVIGVWPAALATELDHFLKGPDRSMRAWAVTAGARLLDVDAPINVNRPADLALLS